MLHVMCTPPPNLESITLHMMVRMASSGVHNLQVDMQMRRGGKRRADGSTIKTYKVHQL
jgi:hypothetical protein